MDYGEACLEQRRIASLLENNQHYQYMYNVLPYYDEDTDGTVLGYFVAVAWYADRYDEDETLHEYGSAVALMNPGASVEALRDTLHKNYLATMAQR